MTSADFPPPPPGPFWVPTTLIFSLFLTSSLSTSISAYLAGSPYTYDFTRLGAATSVVYARFSASPLSFLVCLSASLADTPTASASLSSFGRRSSTGLALRSVVPSRSSRSTATLRPFGSSFRCVSLSCQPGSRANTDLLRLAVAHPDPLDHPPPDSRPLGNDHFPRLPPPQPLPNPRQCPQRLSPSSRHRHHRPAPHPRHRFVVGLHGGWERRV